MVLLDGYWWGGDRGAVNGRRGRRAARMLCHMELGPARTELRIYHGDGFGGRVRGILVAKTRIDPCGETPFIWTLGR